MQHVYLPLSPKQEQTNMYPMLFRSDLFEMPTQEHEYDYSQKKVQPTTINLCRILNQDLIHIKKNKKKQINTPDIYLCTLLQQLHEKEGDGASPSMVRLLNLHRDNSAFANKSNVPVHETQLQNHCLTHYVAHSTWSIALLDHQIPCNKALHSL